MRRPRAGRLIQNAVALIVSGGGTAVFGVAFWGVAAHRVSPTVVGRMSAEIAVMMLLATLAQLGFDSTFERFIPIAGDQTRKFITRAYTICILVALGLAFGYVSLGFGNRMIPSSFGWRALFVFMTALWTVFALQDSVLIGLRDSRWVPVKNIIYSVVKLAIIPLTLIISHGQGIFIAWTAPVLLLVLIVNWYLLRRRIPYHQSLKSPDEDFPSVREFVDLATAQYATLLINIIAPSAVTLIVIQKLGAAASSHYYLPAQIAGGASQLLWSINRSFLVEASSESHALREHARVALRAGIFVLIISMTTGLIAAPWILRIFGLTYSQSGTTLLRMLFLALPGYAIATFFSSFALLERRVWWMVARDLVSALIYFGAIFILIGHFGILSIGIAGLIESGLLGIFFLPALIKRYRLIAVEVPS